MNLKPTKKLLENKLWEASLIENNLVMLFSWKSAPIVSDDDYKNAILTIAKLSLENKPHIVLIDKTLRTDKAKFDHDWWLSTILPMYHKAGFAGLAHITGSNQAMGEYSNNLEGVNFKMAEFSDMDSALLWKV